MKTHLSTRRAVSVPLAALTIAAGSLLTGCGGDSDNSKKPTPVKVNAVKLKVDEPAGRFDKSSVEVKAGLISIQVQNANNSKRKHGVALIDGKRRTAGSAVGPGRTTGLTIALKPGNYKIVDSVKGKRNAGFFANLTVTK